MKPEAFWLLILVVIIAVIYEIRSMHRETLQQKHSSAEQEAAVIDNP